MHISLSFTSYISYVSYTICIIYPCLWEYIYQFVYRHNKNDWTATLLWMKNKVLRPFALRHLELEYPQNTVDSRSKSPF